MKAWRVLDFCEPEQMQLQDIELPVPKAGEVRIKNHAAALNFFDILLIQGKYQVKPPRPFTTSWYSPAIIVTRLPSQRAVSVGWKTEMKTSLRFCVRLNEFTVTAGAAKVPVLSKMERTMPLRAVDREAVSSARW